MALRPYQTQPAADLLSLLKTGQNVVDLSDTGTGKTYMAAAVSIEWGRPTLAVVPKIAVTGWQTAAESLGDKLSVIGYEQLRTGRTPYGWWDNNPPPGFRSETWFKCQCCQLEVDFDDYRPCYCHPAGIHCIETKKIPWQYGRFNFAPEIKFLIWDEIHRCGAIDSLNTDMLIAARRQNMPILGLSATAACGPLQMRALGYVLGLHNLTGFYSWTRRYGCGKIDGLPGWHWLKGKAGQKEVMGRIRDEIIPRRGVRVRTQDIPGFPSRTIDCQLFDVDGADKIDALYAEMVDALAMLEKRKEMDAAADHPLTMILRTRQKIGLLKVPLMVELAQDYLAKGFSVGLFLNFKQEMDELRRRLKCDCFIDGSSEGQRNRQASIEAFQADEERLILVNSEAGGVAVSLHDLNGEYPRYGLVMPCFNARTFKQLVGRFHREGGRSPCYYKVVLAARTVETGIYSKLMAKVNNIDFLNDGDLTTDL